MAEQSRLENIGITKRTQLTHKNDYIKTENEFSEQHKDALSDGDPLGKGNGISMGVAVANTDDFYIDEYGNRSQRMNYNNLVTHESGTKTIGGLYDRFGKPELGHSGRLQLLSMNKYQEGHEYGPDSIDTTANRLDGQYIDKDIV